MFKYLVIVNLLIMMVVTQDMPPPDLDISTKIPLTTTEPTTQQPTTLEPTTLQPTTPEPETTTTTTTTTEPVTTTTEAETSTTTTTEAITTTAAAITTTEAVTTTTEPTTTISTTTPTTTVTTKRSDVPIPPVTDSPFLPATTTTPRTPYYPNYPDYSGMRCYFRKQYGYAQLRWTCEGFKYFYPIECFKCCLLPYSSFAGCYRVHGHNCNSLNHHYGGYQK